MNRISEDGLHVESYNEWSREWEIWHCPQCGVETLPGEGFTRHEDFCNLR